MDPIDRLTKRLQEREKFELEKFVRKIVKDEVDRLLNTKYDSESLLTATEVKDRYNTSLSTINRYVNDETLKCNQSHAKGRRLFKKADCDAVFLKGKK